MFNNDHNYNKNYNKIILTDALHIDYVTLIIYRVTLHPIESWI